MATMALLVVIMYVIWRFTGFKRLQKRIQMLENKAEKLERDVKILTLYGRDN